MFVNHIHYRAIWPESNFKSVSIIDQTKLPFHFEHVQIDTLEKMIHAISCMQVRGAPLIGASAAYGLALAMLNDSSNAHLCLAAEQLIQSRPTAVNLAWAVNRMVLHLTHLLPHERVSAAWLEAAKIADEDVEQNRMIGQHGLALIAQAYQEKTFHILTHCNAGWLATVDFGTALSPIYAAHDAGLALHVWVDETRPRNQGASLTAWELGQHGVPHTVISDNAGGHLMQQGQVDMVIVGADRVAANGDVCNKIGTYLKALAADDNQIPFYAAVPSPTIDIELAHGRDIVIEERHHDEVAYMQGHTADGRLQSVRVIPVHSNAANPAFDVTPARLVTGIITEKGVFAPNQLAKGIG
jgi:methylthioribose-1-phosphate isomerase